MKSDSSLHLVLSWQKEQFQLHCTVERFMAGKHSSLPWAITFGIINKNAVTDYFLAGIFYNTIGVVQSTGKKKLGLIIYM